MYSVAQNKYFGIFILVSILLHAWVLLKFPVSQNNNYINSSPTINLELSRVIIQDKKTASVIHEERVIKKAKVIAALSEKDVTEIPTKTEKTIKEKTAEKIKNISEPEKQLSNITKANKNLYLQELYNAIENNKYYPSSARRRGMQDTVSVSFHLLASGEIEDLIIQTRFKPLRLAAQTAVKESLPFQQPPDELETPLKIQYAMAFKLN